MTVCLRQGNADSHGLLDEEAAVQEKAHSTNLLTWPLPSMARNPGHENCKIGRLGLSLLALVELPKRVLERADKVKSDLDLGGGDEVDKRCFFYGGRD